jgi:GNAT superfamily N-acetyltransferase
MDGEEANLDDSFFADLRSVVRNYEAAGGDFLVGVVGDSLVACGGCVPLSSTEVEIKRMRVHPAHRGKGYGRALLAALEVSSEGRGFAVVRVETTTAQLAALNLDQSSGYQQISETQVRGFDVRQFTKRIYGTKEGRRLRT